MCGLGSRLVPYKYEKKHFIMGHCHSLSLFFFCRRTRRAFAFQLPGGCPLGFAVRPDVCIYSLSPLLSGCSEGHACYGHAVGFAVFLGRILYWRLSVWPQQVFRPHSFRFLFIRSSV